jgi:hypothetical protein
VCRVLRRPLPSVRKLGWLAFAVNWAATFSEAHRPRPLPTTKQSQLRGLYATLLELRPRGHGGWRCGVWAGQVPGAQRRVQPQLESPARTWADGSTADLRGRGKPAQPNTPANAGRALPLRAPAPALRLGPQVERPGCGRVARGCARLRGARGAALSPPSELSALFHGKLRALRARGRASPGGRVQGSGKWAQQGRWSWPRAPRWGFPPALVPGRFLHAPPRPVLPGWSTRRAGCWELRSCRSARGSLLYHPGSAGLAPAAGAQVGMPILELQAGSYGVQRPETWGRGAREGSVQFLPNPLPRRNWHQRSGRLRKKQLKKKKKKKKERKKSRDSHYTSLLLSCCRFYSRTLINLLLGKW